MSTNRIKVLLVSLLAVFAIGAGASASASAHQFVGCFNVGASQGTFSTGTCATAGGAHEFAKAYVGAANHWFTCLKGAGGTYSDSGCSILTGTPKEWSLHDTGLVATVKGTSGESVLKSELDFVKLTIKCGKDTFSGDLNAGGKTSNTVITYEECALANPAGESCEVNATLPTSELKDELVSGSGSRLEDKFESEGTHFIEIEIKQKSGKTCTPKGTYPITGSQTCEVDKTNAEAETQAADHKIICSTTGSKLKLGPEKATYEGTATVGLGGGGNWAAE